MNYKVSTEPSGAIFLEIPDDRFQTPIAMRRYISVETARRLWLELGDALLTKAPKDEFPRSQGEKAAGNTEANESR